LSADLSVLRQSLLFSGLEAIAYNLNRKTNNLKLYEFGKTYHKFEKGFDEQKHFSLLLTGNRNSDSWILENRKTDFFYLKGIINTILERIGINSTGSKPSKNDIFSEGVMLHLGKQSIVEFGVVKPTVAKEFGIEDYPAPAGGCVLTDPILAKRLHKVFNDAEGVIPPQDARFLLVGRQFLLPHGSWLAMGRRQDENYEVLALKQGDDILLKLEDIPGPTGLLRHLKHEDDVKKAAALVARYGKTVKGLDTYPVKIDYGDKSEIIEASPLDDSVFKEWLR